ncbi:hypothetical protein NVP1231O_24 [Vibrio phage 1.231.O._10N.261.49.F8]|nr:hypothetical protein NVP1119O_24 [Vibrio phage 1.119.O._10N.261.51.A9]AUR89618.1 hypothetical protein NVP1127O_26 [Vibrio phage 1.127.O._10N.286.52.E12]AUR90396.1 hypothetical protein NVP1143O_24 [Vibrio phage 1.143.O._10N.261.55.C8]AUR96682.1 hypothetical protein NVP1231O_24 [Vibrio phage 1.231.O._10N.261.49.F8]
MHQKHWKFTQSTPAATWDIDNIPENATGAVITHIDSDDGQILQPDNQIKAPSGIQLSFGVEAVSGVAYGTYYTEEDDTTIVEHDGNVVNIYMNPKI